MNISLADITMHRSRLRQEIMERECLLAAFDVVERFAASGHTPSSMGLSGVLSSLVSDEPTKTDAPATPPPVPLLPPVERYVHPELKGHLYQSNAARVRWAVQRMTDNFSLTDVYGMLEREGGGVSRADISVVLSRLRDRGEIVPIRGGAGPIPTLYRNPNPPEHAPADPAAQLEGTGTLGEDGILIVPAERILSQQA